ncbi:C-type lectin domain family 4 member E-like [Erpetoichthys calabaricus]|uniref:C-type lectin domain family 4 member E-like n=1 Tax=Erpetoichthys calabaricus TaxID=27687 RepID=UPI00223419DC|nr:C-type lectin domain family 4 member E-like [Erpetoichthys calabaricus]
MTYCFALLTVLNDVFYSDFIKLHLKEQDLEELKNANYNLTSTYNSLLEGLATLQSQYTRNYSALLANQAAQQSQCKRNYSDLLESCAALESQHTRNYSALLESRATLQSQYRTLNEKYDELSKELRNLKEYYCYVISLSWISFSTEITCPVCEVGWVLFNSKCYFFSTVKLTWELSRDQCVIKGGHLVIVESSREQEFLENKINIMGGEEKFYWIGLNDKVKENEFVWVDGTPLSTNNRFWDGNQPNGDFNENCVQIWMKSVWNHWHDFPCATPTKWVCETTSSLLQI